MDYIIIIKEKLSSLGEDYDSIKPYMIKHIIEIETLLRTKQETRLQAIETIKNLDFSLSGISKDLQMSRTTLYNHEQLLKRYIEFSISELGKWDPFVEQAKLKSEKSDLRTEIALLMDRDLDMELLKQKNSQLTANLKEKNKEVERLHKRLTELNTDLREARSQNNSKQIH